MFGYVFFLIFIFPCALLIHSITSEKLGITKNILFEAFVYGVFCSPCIVIIGEGYRNKTLALVIYALFQGYDNAFTLLQMGAFTFGLYVYLLITNKK